MKRSGVCAILTIALVILVATIYSVRGTNYDVAAPLPINKESVRGYSSGDCFTAYGEVFLKRYPLLHLDVICQAQLASDAPSFEAIRRVEHRSPLEKAWNWITAMLRTRPTLEDCTGGDMFRFGQCVAPTSLYVDRVTTRAIKYLSALMWIVLAMLSLLTIAEIQTFLYLEGDTQDKRQYAFEPSDLARYIPDCFNIHQRCFTSIAEEARWMLARKRVLFRTCFLDEAEVEEICFLTYQLEHMGRVDGIQVEDKYPVNAFVEQYSKVAQDLEAEPGAVDADPKYYQEQIDTIALLRKYNSKYLEVSEKRSWASRLFPFSGAPPPTNGKSV